MNKLKQNNKNECEIWSSNFKPIKLEITMSPKLYYILKTIQNTVNAEFSVLAKGQFDEDGFRILDDYYIPKQTVSISSVDYEENIAVKRRDGYNVIIHSHPSQYSSFSVNDESTINSHFECSILLNNEGEPIKGVINLEIDGRVYQIETAVKIGEEASNVIGIDKIRKKEYNYIQYYNGSKFYRKDRDDDDYPYEYLSILH